MDRLPLVFDGNVAKGDAFRGNIDAPAVRHENFTICICRRRLIV
jgi:hypothetical protein